MIVVMAAIEHVDDQIRIIWREEQNSPRKSRWLALWPTPDSPSAFLQSMVTKNRPLFKHRLASPFAQLFGKGADASSETELIAPLSVVSLATAWIISALVFKRGSE
jgi:hypothetical protein